MGEQGRVVLRVHVAAEGLPTEVLLHASSGSPRLDDSALATVRRWKFVPARLGAEAVAAWVLVPIAFTLKD
jgi:protein TonB